jgi:predicted O-methyltransferase YrrM
VAQKHELKRLESDRKLDEMLRTEAGRSRYWEQLAEQAKQDTLIELFVETLCLDGDVIECGVYRGGSLFRLSRALKDNSAHKTIYACDSFEGFPEDRVGLFDRTLFRPLRKLRAKFRVAHDVPARIDRFAEYYDVPIKIVKGFFAETLPQLDVGKFCFIHLDVDIYESYKECLEQLYPRLAPGGVVVFDEYNSSKWPGAKKAVDEFFAERSETIQNSSKRATPAWYVRKAMDT